MAKFAVTEAREVEITLSKEDAAQLLSEMDDVENGITPVRNSTFEEIKKKLVSALYKSMRDGDDGVGPVE
jgi:hypothetical protein